MDAILENPALTYEYVCVSDHSREKHEEHPWYIHVSGPGTYASRGLLKESGLNWNATKKVWWKYVRAQTVPDEQRLERKSEYIRRLHDQGLTYPLRRTKCDVDGCNEERRTDNDTKCQETKCQETKCHECAYKQRCAGGLECGGWMSNRCKYDEPTMVGRLSCAGCSTDATAWAKLGLIT